MKDITEIDRYHRQLIRQTGCTEMLLTLFVSIKKDLAIVL